MSRLSRKIAKEIYDSSGNMTILPQNLFLSNSSVITEGLETTGDWTPASGTAVTNTSENKSGTQSVKLTSASGAATNITKTMALDLTGNWQQARFWAYLHNDVADYATPSSLGLRLFSTFASASYWIPLNTGALLRSGWNLIKMPKSDFIINNGSPTWTITTVRFQFTANVATIAAISFDDLIFDAVTKPAVMFRFDDGYRTQYSEAYLYMKARNVRGTLYQISDWISEVDPTRLNVSMLQEMYASGWVIGNHTKTHADLDTLSEAQQESEISQCTTALAAIGIPTAGQYIAYPQGKWNANTRIALSNLGFRLGQHAVQTVRIGSTIMLPIMFPIYDPQMIGCSSLSTSTSLAVAKTYADQCKASGAVWCPLFHGIGTGGSTWSVSDFRALVDYCIQIGLPFITMDDMYKLQTNAIRIPKAL